MSKKSWQSLNLGLALTLALGLLLAVQNSPTAHAADTPAGWTETTLTVKFADVSNLCLDPLQPDTILTYEPQGEQGTFALNWKTGTREKVAPRYFYHCDEANGYFYTPTDNANEATRYSLRERQGVKVVHRPYYFAQDGSLQVYALEDGKLFASSDAGTTWQERGSQLSGKFWLTVAGADAKAIYLMTRADTDTAATYSLYFSPDAGQNWDKRSERTIAKSFLPPVPSPLTPSGRYAPVSLIGLSSPQGAGSNGFATIEISLDGGRTFKEVATNGKSGYSQFFYTPDGLLELRKNEPGSYSLRLSADGGKTWENRTVPFSSPANPNEPGARVRLLQADNAPANLFYHSPETGDVWQSVDSGKTWRKVVATMPTIRIGSYAPTTLVGFDIKTGKVYTYSDLAAVDATQTASAPASGAQGSDFYPETRHNLSGVFKNYWLANGGLAQFGYPRTEPFREYNPADGKIYTVQYFERNRFEYHPEFAGTKYEVLLGLLGNQLTADYRAQGHGAFNRFENQNYPGGVYFPQTGHNLRNTFKEYWEKNGGLAIYGYPISEEFQEVNPDDGKTYVVQYFERNRFEWHPENKGTKYEVLLGLLGNSLLRAKGWL